MNEYMDEYLLAVRAEYGKVWMKLPKQPVV